MLDRIRHRLHEILDAPEPHDTPSTVFNVFITTLILLNVLSVSLETVKALATRYNTLFKGFEVFSVAVFSIEYVLRVWTATSGHRFKRPVEGRLRYMATPFALVDATAILPFYILLFAPHLAIGNWSFLRAGRLVRLVRLMRLMRLMRVARLGRFAESMRTLAVVIKRAREELIITLFALFVLLMLTSGVMYYIENTAQPEAFSSIPATMWWAIAALTTVGYGDIVPITPLGKCLAGIIAVLGVGLFGLPAGILAAGFIEEVRSRHQKQRTCPHCGKPLE